MHQPSLRDLAAVGLIAIAMPCAAAGAPRAAALLPIEQGFVDAGGVLVYYEALGAGDPLMILHGGPGASHDYLLPYVLSLARTNRVVFIDERGSGRSEKLEDPAGYTVETMVEDVGGRGRRQSGQLRLADGGLVPAQLELARSR